MKDLGKYLHTTPQGLAIIKLKIVPPIGAVVIDAKGRQVGSIADVFGPVASPYGSVKLVLGIGSHLDLEATELYLGDAKQSSRRNKPGRP